MCLYPKLITNPKYKPNKKNGGRPPIARDKRVLKVPISCGNCMECRKQNSRQWQVRLHEELRHNKHHAEFVTLTFSTESLIDLSKEFTNVKGYALDNAIATKAVRRFNERYRKKFKVAPRHWLVTELGHGQTEHLHIHGIIWNHRPRHERQKCELQNINQFKEDIKNLWGYGHVGLGEYVNERTVNYIIKYIHKTDKDHQAYKAITLCSKGIGNNYTVRTDSRNNAYKEGQTREYYTNRQGFKLALPTYYRNKIYSEEEREKLWLEKLDKGERWVLGTRINIKYSEEEYYKTLRYAQSINTKLGYGNREMWQVKEYEEQRRSLKHEERIRKSLEFQYIDTETGEILVNPTKKQIIRMNLKEYGRT